jgi:signal transduction histidine kinase
VVDRAILDAVPVPVVYVDRELTVRYANPAFATVEPVPAEWSKVAADALCTNVTVEHTTTDDPEVRVTAVPVPGADGQSDGVVVSFVRLGPRSPIERFRRVMDAAPFPAWLRHSDGRYAYANPVYLARVPGANGEVAGKRPDDFWPVDLAEQFLLNDRKVRDGGRTVESVEPTVGPDGSARLWINIKYPFGDRGEYVAGVGIDVTDRTKGEEERRALERQLLHAQKMDSLGVMAGGLAHDFNNLLTTILGNSSLARMNVSDPSPVTDCLKKVEGAAVRAAELCQLMLAYAGRGQLVVTEVDLNGSVREVVGVLGSVVSKRAVMTLRLADRLPPIRGDAGQVRQAILNLITNASDALGDRSGEVTVSTGVEEVDADHLARLPDAKHLTPGRYAFVEVADTGSGMDETTKARMFEPFFTTKFTGRGLGLSAVQGIVRGHKGLIRVATQSSKGTTFRVLLPVPVSAPAADARPAFRSGRGRTILLVDDEDDVRLVSRRLLEAAGFNVLLATDGMDAVTTYRNFHPHVAAVLLDLTMPRMGGAEALGELRQIRPDAKVILISGYGRQEALSGIDEKELFAFLRKPFTGDELIELMFRAVGD